MTPAVGFSQQSVDIFCVFAIDLRVSGCYGMFVPGPNPAHVTMATLDRRTTLAVELAHTRALDEARGAAIQAGYRISCNFTLTSCL